MIEQIINSKSHVEISVLGKTDLNKIVYRKCLNVRSQLKDFFKFMSKIGLGFLKDLVYNSFPTNALYIQIFIYKISLFANL